MFQTVSKEETMKQLEIIGMKHNCYIHHDVFFNELDFDLNKMCDTSQQELEVTEVSSKRVNIDLEEREPDDTEQETPLRRSKQERRPCICYGIDVHIAIRNHKLRNLTPSKKHSPVTTQLNGKQLQTVNTVH